MKFAILMMVLAYLLIPSHRGSTGSARTSGSCSRGGGRSRSRCTVMVVEVVRVSVFKKRAGNTSSRAGGN